MRTLQLFTLALLATAARADLASGVSLNSSLYNTFGDLIASDNCVSPSACEIDLNVPDAMASSRVEANAGASYGYVGVSAEYLFGGGGFPGDNIMGSSAARMFASFSDTLQFHGAPTNGFIQFDFVYGERGIPLRQYGLLSLELNQQQVEQFVVPDLPCNIQDDAGTICGLMPLETPLIFTNLANPVEFGLSLTQGGGLSFSGLAHPNPRFGSDFSG